MAFLAAAAAGDAGAFVEEARARAAAKDYCGAHESFVRAYQAGGDDKNLYNAAEVSFAARDRATALALFNRLRAEHPEFEVEKVQERIAAVTTAIGAYGPGDPCPPVVMEPETRTVVVPQLIETEAPSPAPLIVTATAGGIAIASALGAGVSALPWLAWQNEAQQLQSLQERFEASGDDVERQTLLDEAALSQGRLSAQRSLWNDVGQWGFIASATATAVGVLGLVAGAVWMGAAAEPDDEAIPAAR